MIEYTVRKFHLTDRFGRKLKTKIYYTRNARIAHAIGVARLPTLRRCTLHLSIASEQRSYRRICID